LSKVLVTNYTTIFRNFALLSRVISTFFTFDHNTGWLSDWINWPDWKFPLENSEKAGKITHTITQNPVWQIFCFNIGYILPSAHIINN